MVFSLGCVEHLKLADKLWLKLYDKPNLKNLFTGILYRLKIGCSWRSLPSIYGKPNAILKHIADGQGQDYFYNYLNV